jgi:hypothetical protein
VVLAVLVQLVVQQTHVQIHHQADVMSLVDQVALTQADLLTAVPRQAVLQQVDPVHQVVTLQ